MEIKTKDDRANAAFSDSDEARRERTVESFWYVAGLLFRRRWFVVAVTGLAAVTAVVISLLLPNYYAASARLLAPEDGGTSPLSAALSSNLATAASALLGGPSGDYLRYIAILGSRNTYERVVDTFNLIEVYETADAEHPQAEAVVQFADRVDFRIDNEYEFLSVVVQDHSPERAAEMANFLVAELNRRNMELAAQNAITYRRFVENRYRETLARIDSLKTAAQAFQEQYGIYDLESQTSAFLDEMAALRTETVAFEIEYEALLSQYGPDNPQVRLAREAYQAAQRRNQAALRGQEAVLPVPQSDVPEVLRRYVDLEQEVLIQKSILEVVAPMYENARFREEREYIAVQVVDEAVPPAKKAGPKRSIIVIVATLSAFLLASGFVLLSDWWARNAAGFAYRLREASRRPDASH